MNRLAIFQTQRVLYECKVLGPKKLDEQEPRSSDGLGEENPALPRDSHP